MCLSISGIGCAVASRSITSTRGRSCVILSWFIDSHGSELALLCSLGHPNSSTGPVDPAAPLWPATPAPASLMPLEPAACDPAACLPAPPRLALEPAAPRPVPAVLPAEPPLLVPRPARVE